MPYVDLPNAHDDYASLWYMTNSATGTVGGFDPARATVLLLHPQFLDSAWLAAQFEDPRLASCYNLIAFDARHAGQTTSRLNGKQDSWTDAADVAFALEVRRRSNHKTSLIASPPTHPRHSSKLRNGRLIILFGVVGALSSRCSCVGV
jgi:pimeloyl-ACP methyl ester carboxylesterase